MNVTCLQVQNSLKRYIDFPYSVYFTVTIKINLFIFKKLLNVINYIKLLISMVKKLFLLLFCCKKSYVKELKVNSEI